jgi:hypothetical protein
VTTLPAAVSRDNFGEERFIPPPTLVPTAGPWAAEPSAQFLAWLVTAPADAVAGESVPASPGRACLALIPGPGGEADARVMAAGRALLDAAELALTGLLLPGGADGPTFRLAVHALRDAVAAARGDGP